MQTKFSTLINNLNIKKRFLQKISCEIFGYRKFDMKTFKAAVMGKYERSFQEQRLHETTKTTQQSTL